MTPVAGQVVRDDASASIGSPSQSQSVPAGAGASLASVTSSVGGGPSAPGAPAPPVSYTSHAWALDGTVYAANTKGGVVVFQPSDGSVVRTAEPAGGVVVTCMVMSRDRLVVGCEDGVVRWLSLHDLTVQRSVTLTPRVRWSEGAPVLPVYGLAACPSYRKLFVCTTEGTIHTLVLDIEDDPSGRKSKEAEFDLERVRARGLWCVVMRCEVLGAASCGVWVDVNLKRRGLFVVEPAHVVVYAV